MKESSNDIPARMHSQFMTVPQAADMLNVSSRTVHNWIKKGSVPYVELPGSEGGRHQYRIPLEGLLSSLSGNYDVQAQLREQTVRARRLQRED